MKSLMFVSALSFAMAGITPTSQAAPLSPSPEPSRASLETACLSEAEWPVVASSTYINASVHSKQQMLNAYNPEVRTLKTLCWRMDKASGGETAALALQCQDLIDATSRKYGTRAAAHLRRTASICSTLTQQKVEYRGV